MSLLPEYRKPFLGWVCYDADCRFCSRLADSVRNLLSGRGFKLIPLQNAWLTQRFDLRPPYTEMALITDRGVYHGGVDALLKIGAAFWWASPAVILAKLPGIKWLLWRAYRFIANHRYCGQNACRANCKRSILHGTRWLPLLALPLAALLLRRQVQPWVFMWLLAFALFLGCKWLTWSTHLAIKPSFLRSAAYLLLWPGIDAGAFLSKPKTEIPPASGWFTAFGKTLFGAVLIWCVAGHIKSPIIAGWSGLLGFVFLLHFGFFHLLALVWQSLGIAAEPIMNSPLLAKSLSEFWSLRWNRGFNQLVRQFAMRPLRRRFGLAGATLGIFVISGLIHDLVISVPATAGYGLPSVYFVIQGCGVLFERSDVAKRLGLGRGWSGWFYTLVVTISPLYWLFHPPFICNVILPFMKALHAL